MTVRVRVTAVATVVTAIALAVGGWGLLRSIESTQLGRIAAEADKRVAALTDQLAAGVPAEAVALDAEPGTFVQVLSASGDVLRSSPAVGADPFLMRAEDASAGTAAAGGVFVTDVAGATRVEHPLPGSYGTASPIDLRWETVVTPDGEVTVAAASPLAEVGRSLDAVRRSLWFGMPMVVALVAAVAWFVTGRALDPVEAMRVEAEAITHSTLHRRVPEPETADEVGRLARTMNAMLDRLESSAERQRRFVADASHELRTPVATLRAELEVARRAGDETSLRRAVDGALAEENRLEALLADLLLLASVEEAPPVGTDPVDLGALVAAEAERPRPVPVSVSGEGEVASSERQLERVVRNLLDNAARHAVGAVEVTVDGGRLVVDDDGPGIPEPDRERIFERFTRLDEGRTRDAGGSGLGLSIVRAVVEATGGTVRAEASPTLGGARFVVTWPAVAPSG